MVDRAMRPGARLGIDVGSVRIGVARSDRDALLATPEETVARGPGDVQRLARLVHEFQVMEVIVGLPLHLSGKEGAAAADARSFAAALSKTLGEIPVRLVDERLTTVTAQRDLQAAGVSARSGRDRIDQAAAVVILQAALDAERVAGRPPGVLLAPAATPGHPVAVE